MLANLILFVKKHSKQNKKIILLIFGVFLFVWFLFSIYQQYFADTIRSYLPENTVFYAHFSAPTMKYSSAFNESVLSIFAQANLPEISWRHLDREVAVVGLAEGEQIRFFLLWRAEKLKMVSDLLNQKKINFRIFDKSGVALALDNSGADEFYQAKEKTFAKKICGHFSPFNSLSLYVDKSLAGFFNNDPLIAILPQIAAADDGQVYLNAQVKRTGLKVFFSGRPKSVSRQLVLKEDYDLIFSAQNPQVFLADWKNLSSDEADVWLARFFGLTMNKNPEFTAWLSGLGERTLLLIKANGRQNNWPLADNDFYLAYDLPRQAGLPVNGLNESSQKNLEIALGYLLAEKYPSENKTVLSDGSRITELVPEPADFPFQDKNGLKIAATPDGLVKLAYKISQNRIMISNNLAWLEQNIPVPTGDYLKIKNNLAPKVGYLDYFSQFNVLELKNGVAWFQ